MKKVKFLLSAAAVVAIVAVAVGVKARTSNVLYFPNPSNTLICDQPKDHRILDPRGIVTPVTTLQGADCFTQKVLVTSAD